MENLQEKELLQQYVRARTRVEAEEIILKEAKSDLDNCEMRLLDFLEASEKKDTGMYPGIGKISITAPQVYASCKEENRESCFAYLKGMDRADLIKETVNARSLSSFAKEILESGQSIPDCISYYLKPMVKFTRS